MAKGSFHLEKRKSTTFDNQQNWSVVFSFMENSRVVLHFMDLPQITYPFSCWWTFGLCPVFVFYEQNCYEHFYTCLCLDICLHFPCVNTCTWNGYVFIYLKCVIILGHELGQTLGDGEGQGSLACCNPWGHRELDWRVGNWTTATTNILLFRQCHLIFLWLW